MSSCNSTPHIIDGKAVSAAIKEEIATQVSELDFTPGLTVILVGSDPASQVYVSNKIKACESAGVKSFENRLPEDTTAEDLASLIEKLNKDPAVHGILVQLPLPDHLNDDEIVQLIVPEKDVDGLTVANAGKLFVGEESLVPCTPQGSLALIKTVQEDLTGMNAVVIGRSLLFGKPMAQLLLNENCTVTTAHSKTKDLPSICRQADILVAATGRSEMVKRDWIKPGAIIIDVGISRIPHPEIEGKTKLVGDVNFNEAKELARAITPVPGGVGPMTIAFLLKNTLKAAELQKK